jgi:hypothetical protein
MSRVSVSLNESTITLRTSGSIVGTIFFRVQDRPFPADDWSDFPIVVLGWWLEAVTSLYSGRDSCEFEFMDGPYSVVVSKIDGEVIRVAPHRNGAPDGDAVTGKLSALSAELLFVANAAYDHCCAKFWSGSDVLTLSDRISALKLASSA